MKIFVKKTQVFVNMGYGYSQNQFLKYLPYAMKAAKPYIKFKTAAQRNQLRKKKKPKTRARGYAGTSRRKYSKVVRNTQSIKKLQQQTRQSLGTMTYRHLDSTAKICNVNQQAFQMINPNNVTQLETVLAQCKFFDPATPGTLVTGSLVAGTYQRNVRFENVSSKLEVRNNFGTTVDVRIYLCKVKDDTNSTAGVAWSDGIPDGSNLSVRENIGQYPSDYDIVKDLYNLKLAKSCTLRPGGAATVTHSTGSFEYSPSTVDTHGLEYQKEYKGFSWMVVFHGGVGHDTVNTEITTMQCGLDMSWTDTYKVKYDAGANISFVHVVNDRDAAFTTGGVMAQTPITDNQAYSYA